MTDDQRNRPSNETQPPIELPAEKARGGEIILRTRARRIVFIAGLVGFVLFIAVFLFLGGR